VAKRLAHIAAWVLIVLVTGCRTTSPFIEEPFIAAMGEPTHLVVSLDVSANNPLLGSALDLSGDPIGQQLVDRSERVSISLYDPYPVGAADGQSAMADLSKYRFFGGFEGNFPKFITNTALLWAPGWEKVENERTHFFKHEPSGLSAAVPRSGLLLFTNGDYMEAFDKTFAKRTDYLDAATARRLQQAMFGFYAASPQAMIDIGLAIPTTVLLQVDTLLLIVEPNPEGKIALGGTIHMKSARLANSLSILLKTSYISERRRNKLPLGDMTDMFVTDGVTVNISAMEMTEMQVASFSNMFGALFATTGGIVHNANL